ncbi:hypothetical protein Leryth_013846 [Lithospermum erythrorhizon]|uniref:Vacuolar iron transporter n=1 Tax=Lithospermum erythrorhizon TaxID=34254 RepID=A0AAV3RA21_LITER|nr:hypothetical protein Leryth_013846 [Lithospermum erythrorhizon]
MASPPPSLESTCVGHKPVTLPEQTTLAKRLKQAQWLRAAILGSSDGLLSTSTLMLGIGAAMKDQQSMVVSGVAGALAGACSMAVGEFASVSTQRDIELSAIMNCDTKPSAENDEAGQIKIRISSDNRPFELSNFQSPGQQSLHGYCPSKSPVMRAIVEDDRANHESGKVNWLPNPYKAGIASGLSFLCGALVPLLAAIGIANREARIIVIIVVTSVALALSGGTGASFGGSKPLLPAMRVLFGGWISMAITYGLLKCFDHDFDRHNDD